VGRGIPQIPECWPASTLRDCELLLPRINTFHPPQLLGFVTGLNSEQNEIVTFSCMLLCNAHEYDAHLFRVGTC
jgi:hypothetical protein